MVGLSYKYGYSIYRMLKTTKHLAKPVDAEILDGTPKSFLSHVKNLDEFAAPEPRTYEVRSDAEAVRTHRIISVAVCVILARPGVQMNGTTPRP
jgi:hypothetical protein